MFRRRFRIFALVLVVLMLPGAVELLENAAHWLVEGHLAHDISEGHAEHGETDEHGCTGAYHMCTCCTVVHVLSPSDTSESAEPVDLSWKSAWFLADAVPSFWRQELFRPPIA